VGWDLDITQNMFGMSIAKWRSELLPEKERKWGT
jgi:hypothetical protein